LIEALADVPDVASTRAVAASSTPTLPLQGNVRRTTEVNRDLLYVPDEHLKPDA
jgi:hypothetical protein